MHNLDDREQKGFHEVKQIHEPSLQIIYKQHCLYASKISPAQSPLAPSSFSPAAASPEPPPAPPPPLTMAPPAPPAPHTMMVITSYM